jgi:hypothetical protein
LILNAGFLQKRIKKNPFSACLLQTLPPQKIKWLKTAIFRALLIRGTMKLILLGQKLKKRIKTVRDTRAIWDALFG